MAPTVYRITTFTSRLLIVVVLMLIGPDPLNASNEDGDTLNQAKTIKTTPSPNEFQIRQTETAFGIPLPLDELFDQITSLPLGRILIECPRRQPHCSAVRLDDPAHDSNECTGGTDLSELDMCLTQSQMAEFQSMAVSPTAAGRRKRQASPTGFSLWKNAVIPYVFNSTFAAKDRDSIISAMSEWEKASCIRFRPANVEDRDVVVFRDGKRCSTNIGRIGREQAVTLAKSCRSKRILIHELGHVIGLIHEHQRFDRDKYVKVLMENVRNMSQERYQFSKLLSGSITDKTVKYDYTSVMHYGKNYFARAPELTTLQTTDRHYQDVIGRAEKPSYSDLETVNRLYKCAAGCPGSLRCGPSCYMDSGCLCRCRAGSDKPFYHGPGPYGNSLPDPTCEYFASRGECVGNIKDTIRPLCAKSCGLYQPKLNGISNVNSVISNTNINPNSNNNNNNNNINNNNILRAEPPSAAPSWAPSNRPRPKPLGSPSFGTHINAPSIKEMSLFQGGMDPVLAFGQAQQSQAQSRTTNRMRQTSFRSEQQFRPPGDSLTQNRISASPGRNQFELEPTQSVLNFRSGGMTMQRQPSGLTGLSDPSSMFGSYRLSRSSNGRTARLFIPTNQRRSRTMPTRNLSTRQRINYLSRKSPRIQPGGFISSNSDFDSFMNSQQNGGGRISRNGNPLSSRTSNSLSSLSRSPYQRGFSRRTSSNYDLNGMGPSSSLGGLGSDSSWLYATNRDRSRNFMNGQTNQLPLSLGNYAGVDAWASSKGRGRGLRGQGSLRSMDRGGGIMSPMSLGIGGPEFGQVDPLSMNVNNEPLPDAQQRQKYSNRNFQQSAGGPSSLRKSTGGIFGANAFKDTPSVSVSSPSMGSMAGINQLETAKREWEFQHQPLLPTPADQQMGSKQQGGAVDITSSLSGTAPSIANRQSVASLNRQSAAASVAGNRQPVAPSGGMRLSLSSDIGSRQSVATSGTNRMLPSDPRRNNQQQQQQQQSQQRQRRLQQLQRQRQQQQAFGRGTGVEKVTGLGARPGVPIDQAALSVPQGQGQRTNVFNRFVNNGMDPSAARHNSQGSRQNIGQNVRQNAGQNLRQNAGQNSFLNTFQNNRPNLRQNQNQRNWNSQTRFNRIPSMSDPLASGILDSSLMDLASRQNALSTSSRTNLAQRQNSLPANSRTNLSQRQNGLSANSRTNLSQRQNSVTSINQRSLNSPTLLNRLNIMQAMSDPVASSALDNSNRANSDKSATTQVNETPSLSEALARGLIGNLNDEKEITSSSSNVTLSSSRIAPHHRSIERLVSPTTADSLSPSRLLRMSEVFNTNSSLTKSGIGGNPRTVNRGNTVNNNRSNASNLSRGIFHNPTGRSSSLFPSGFLGTARNYINLASSSTGNMFHSLPNSNNPNSRSLISQNNSNFNSLPTNSRSLSNLQTALASQRNRAALSSLSQPQAISLGESSSFGVGGQTSMTASGQRPRTLGRSVIPNNGASQTVSGSSPNAESGIRSTRVQPVALAGRFTQRLPDETRAGQRLFR